MSTHSRSWWQYVLSATLVTMAAVATLQTPAHAAPTNHEKLHRQALKAAKRGQYSKAAKLWLEASLEQSEPRYRYHLGDMAQRMDKPVRALRYYKRFLAKAPRTKQYARMRAKAERAVQLLRGKVAVLKLQVDEPVAKVILDGKHIGTSPLKRTIRLRPGQHVVVVQKAGCPTAVRKLQLDAGVTKTLVVRLQVKPASASQPEAVKPAADGTKVRYPMPRWIPWTLLGAGVAVALAGLGPFFQQSKLYDEYDHRVSTGNVDTSLLNKAKALKSASFSMFAIGGALVIAGVITLVLNQPKVVKPGTTAAPTTPRLFVTGGPTPTGWAFTLGGRF